MISYAVMIFQELGTAMNPHVCSIVLAISMILGSLASTYLADKLGRKFLNVTSLFGSAFGLFSTALYHYFNLNGFDLTYFKWVPVTSLSFVIFISAAGIWGLSLICSVEYLPHKVCIFRCNLFPQDMKCVVMILGSSFRRIDWSRHIEHCCFHNCENLSNFNRKNRSAWLFVYFRNWYLC